MLQKEIFSSVLFSLLLSDPSLPEEITHVSPELRGVSSITSLNAL